MSSTSSSHHVVIIGGGAAGLTSAALLCKRRAHWRITLVEPSATHYYQPAFTTVGGGAYPMAKTMRPTANFIPRKVIWLQTRATKIDADNNRVMLESGETLSYDTLVVCPGLINDFSKIEGLEAALGKNGVTSNYVTGMAEYTWQLIDEFKGGTAVFTQPPVPFKCPGAPQKIAYLAADRWQQRGFLKSSQVHFHTAGPSMFGVPEFAKELLKVVARYGIQAHFGHNLVAVDGARKIATFERTVGDVKERIEQAYDILHAVPHEVTPAFVRDSSLVNAAGFVEVHQNSLQHVRYPNVFSIGDACSTANSKTAAAIRKQAPVMVANLLAFADGQTLTASYDGYGSCPLTTSLNTVMLAEFIYGGKITPTFNMNPFTERKLWWWGKLWGFPMLYWRMLKGGEFDIAHSSDKAKAYLPV